MKKSLLIASIACLAMVSCKKDYTCECTFTSSGSSTPTVTDVTIHDTKSKAKTACDQSATSGGAGWSCVIK